MNIISGMNRIDIIRATAFVDWNSQIHAARLPSGMPEKDLASGVLSYVGRVIGLCLRNCAPECRFDVTLRLYHGWLKGFEITSRRKALTHVIAAADFSSLSETSNVIVREDVHFGDCLISAHKARLHERLGCHLPNTFRKSLKDPEVMEEKMVDTAIASDVVDLAHRDQMRWLVLVGEDDDLIPPLYVAEGARRENEGRVILIRSRPDTAFFKINDLRYRP